MSLPTPHQALADTVAREPIIHPIFAHSTTQRKNNFTKVHPQVSWGDLYTPPSTTHLWIVFQNSNTLSKVHCTCFSYLNTLKSLEPHIFGLVETNLNWSHFPTKTTVYSSLKACWPQLRVATSHLIGAFPNCPSTQAGGCLQLTSGCTSRRVQGSFSDPMGRWCSQTLQGDSNHLITIITACRVCQTAQSGLLTAYEQQWRYLITQTYALHPHPRQSMLKDLQSFIQSQVGQTHHIFLMWDANSTLHNLNIQAFMTACQLHNLQSGCKSTIPINTSA